MEPPLTTAPLLRPLLFHLLPEPFQNSKVIFLIHCLTVKNPFNVNERLEIKKRNDHGLLLRPAHLCLLGPGESPVFPLSTLTSGLRVVGEHPTLVTSHYVIQVNLNQPQSFRECQCISHETVSGRPRESLARTWHRICEASDLQSELYLLCQYLYQQLQISSAQTILGSLTFALPQCFPPCVHFLVLQIWVHLQPIHFL